MEWKCFYGTKWSFQWTSSTDTSEVGRSGRLKDVADARLLLRYKSEENCIEAWHGSVHRLLLQGSFGLLCGFIGFSICIVSWRWFCASWALRVVFFCVCLLNLFLLSGSLQHFSCWFLYVLLLFSLTFWEHSWKTFFMLGSSISYQAQQKQR